MKKYLSLLGFVLIFASIVSCSGDFSKYSELSESETKKAEVESVTEEQTTEEPITNETPTEDPVSNTETTEELTHRSGDEFVGISDKKFSDNEINIDLQDSVRNDVTGNWKLARTSDVFNIEEYALDYYNTYFNDDNEIHAVVNFTNNTTTNISYMFGILDVAIHEYVDKEEHDANILFSGDVIEEYYVYIDNGDIEKIR